MEIYYTQQGDSLPKRAKANNAQRKGKWEQLRKEEIYGEEAGEGEIDEGGRWEAREEA